MAAVIIPENVSSYTAVMRNMNCQNPPTAALLKDYVKDINVKGKYQVTP